MSRFTQIPTSLSGVYIIERTRIGDHRGFLERMFCATDLADAGWRHPIRQINRTFTAQTGAVRGLHFQAPPSAEMKLVSCTAGRVFDVAVDLRRGSPTFLHWTAVELSGENETALLIPQGVAHGFQALEDGCEMLYLHSADYNAAHEGGLNCRDPRIAVEWPMTFTDRSARDEGFAWIDDSYEGIDL